MTSAEQILHKAILDLGHKIDREIKAMDTCNNMIMEEINVLKSDIKNMKPDVTELNEIKLRAKGALWLGRLIGGSGLIGGIIASIMAYLKHKDII